MGGEKEGHDVGFLKKLEARESDFFSLIMSGVTYSYFKIRVQDVGKQEHLTACPNTR